MPIRLAQGEHAAPSASGAQNRTVWR